MPLRIKCPSGHSLIVSESRAGQTFRCPKCQGEVRVPGDAVKPPPVVVRPPEEKKPAAKPPALDPKGVVKQPVTKQQPIAPPVPAALAREAKEIKEVEPPPVVLPVPQASAATPAIPVALDTQAPPTPPPVAPPVTVASPAVDPVPPPVIITKPPDKASLVQSVLVGSPMSAEGVVLVEVAPPPSHPAPLEAAATDVAKTILPVAAAATPVPAPQSISPPLPHRPSPLTAAELTPPLVHSPQQVAIVLQLAAAMIVTALFSVFPSAWDLVVYLNGTSASPLGRWAIVLGMLGAVQVAYAIYLIQLPDWTTVWMVTLFALASAALYAMALGLTIISGEDGWLVRFLQLSDKVAGGKAALWCLCMMSVMTLLAFFAGRISVRWRQAEAVLREAA